MLLRLSILPLLSAMALAQTSSSDATGTATSTGSRRTSSSSSSSRSRAFYEISGASTITNPSVAIPTGPYQSITGQVSGVTSLDLGSTFSRMSAGNFTATSNSLLIVGQTATMSRNMTATTRTTSSATPTNTQACNQYPEFCTRKYSNITGVAAHNAALARKNNAFSNQDVPILGQLNDGIRMIQGEVHYENFTLYNCHSECSFLNTGPYEDTLITIRQWLEANPYEVVTLLIVNSNYANVTAFEEPFQNSGILDYIYLPSKRPMQLDDWPTLGEMILQNTRVVAFMDYNADASLVPYILDEFSNMWETPFSPTDVNFPCTQQRPPGLSESAARDELMYLANHNLNVEISLMGESILIPNFADLELVNANNDSVGALLRMAENCTTMWNRPPNWLLVDFYDEGSGSVFEVAAKYNNVTYTGTCCGQKVGLNAAPKQAATLFGAVSAMLVTLFVLYLQ